MPSNTYPIIAREGWYLLGILVVLTVLVYLKIGISVTLPLIVLVCITLFLFRDPIRTVPSLPLALVSPVHGKVISIKTVEDPWVPRMTARIRLQMSVLDIYSLRSPIGGKIMNQWSLSPDEEYSDRRFVFWVQTDEGDDVVTDIQLNMLTAQMFDFYLHSGERTGQGQRCGFLKLGGQVDVYVPDNCKINVKPGEYVNSGSDILAHLVHSDSKPASIIKDDQAAGSIAT